MPWKIDENHPDCKGWAVVKIDDGEVEGCHSSRQAALSQLAALNANEKKAVKLLSSDEAGFRVGGYGMVWGGKDLVGEYFMPETDLWFDRVTDQPMVLYEHGLDAGVQRMVIGRVDTKSTDEIGLWIEAQISRHNEYSSAIQELIKQDKLGWSSGAVQHLVEIEETGLIKSWPVVEFSLTPTPAEPRTLGVSELRTLVKTDASLEAVLPKDEPSEGDSVEATVSGTADSINITISLDNGDLDMSENTPVEGQKVPAEVTPAAPDYGPEITEIKSQVLGLTEAVNAVLEMAQSQKKFEGGYITNVGGASDPEVKSFGDWLLAVKRNDVKRLTTVYRTIKDMAEDVGTTGGYLVPTEFMAELLRITKETSPITQRVRRIPVTVDTGEWPSLNQFTAPSTAGAGDTAFAGGLLATATAEGAALTETQPTFENITWRVNKLGGYVEVSNEMVTDSAVSVEALLQGLFSLAIANKLEHYILRGDGVGEPLGILNAACAIAVAPGTDNDFDGDDALTMLSRFKSVGGQPVWLMHPGVIPDFGDFTANGQDLVEWTSPLRASLLGYPIIYSEHLPQDDNAGAIILADLSAYLLFERQALSVAFSEHAAFTNDKGTWRFLTRVDGQPWLAAAITLADPQGSYTVSPFVYHND